MDIKGPQPPHTRSQKVSLLALKSMRTSDDVRVMQMVGELIALEARPATIHELTGVEKRVVTQLYEREAIRSMTGRRTESVGGMLQKPRQHLEVSYFVSRYSAGWLEDDKKVSAKGFLRAYQLYLALASDETVIKPEAAVLLATKYHEDAIHLTRCESCHAYWLRSREIIKIGWAYGNGECPFCRHLAIKLTGGLRGANANIREARRNFARLCAPEKDG